MRLAYEYNSRYENCMGASLITVQARQGAPGERGGSPRATMRGPGDVVPRSSQEACCRPHRRRFRNRPLREIPRSCAASSTRPCARSSARRTIVCSSSSTAAGSGWSSGRGSPESARGGGRDRAARRLDLRRQSAGVSVASGFGERDHAADLVGELPDVAGPGVEQQVLERLVARASAGPSSARRRSLRR